MGEAVPGSAFSLRSTHNSLKTQKNPQRKGSIPEQFLPLPLPLILSLSLSLPPSLSLETKRELKKRDRAGNKELALRWEFQIQQISWSLRRLLASLIPGRRHLMYGLSPNRGT